MNPETETESQERPTSEQPATPSGQGDQPRRHRGGRGRGRFRRGGRGRGNRDDRDRDGQRGEQQPQHAESRGTADAHHQEPGHGHESHKGPATIAHAIQQIENIRGELQKVLDDIQETLETLEQVEREKTASDEEIEMLRESLHLLQREPGRGRPSRGNPPLRTSYSAPPQAPIPGPADDEADD